VSAAGIEEGGSKVAIFGCRQSIDAYRKEPPLSPYIHEGEYKVINSTIVRHALLPLID
jgi:hypothetical protein